jgi:hypothetical protein
MAINEPFLHKLFSKKMKSYDTVVEAINDLKERGFNLDLNIEFDRNLRNGNHLNATDFEIVETYRFEGDSNPEDEDIVLAMASTTSPMKGVFTGAFGMYADAAFLSEINTFKEHKTQDG